MNEDSLEQLLTRLGGVRSTGRDSWIARCPVPAHGAGRGDRNPSLAIRRGGRGILSLRCFAGCGVDDILACLRSGDVTFGSRRSLPVLPPALVAGRTFTPGDARRLWEASVQRVRDGRVRDVAGYLLSRGIPAGGGEILYGRASDFRSPWLLACPLYDVATAELVNVQLRRIDRGGEPKVRVPRGSRVAGTAFMNARARENLRGGEDPAPWILGEGLTDFLALAQATSFPVLSAVGVSNAPGAIGPWARNRKVLMALDADRPGEDAARRVALRILREGGQPFRLRWPSLGKDVCDLIESWGFQRFTDELKEALEEIVR